MKGGKVVNVGSAAAGRARERWIYGIHAVRRRLEVQPKSLIEVRIVRGAGRRSTLAALAAKVGVRHSHADEATLHKISGTTSHQGVAALSLPYAYQDLETVIERAPGPLLALDQIQDPNNLGALLRTAAAAGMRAAILPDRGAAAITPSVEKTAAGAVNDIAVCRVGNLSQTLRRLQALGYWSIALLPRGGESLFSIDLPDRPVLVLGGEGGIRPLVESSCDLRASIPQNGPVESLNASVAGAIAMYELVRRGPLRGL